ncbi:malate dehydrogenase [Anaeramoeba flamelloides]|uniref:Malate dehydrogenase n=1 Tax=Anaeramoeba flamelloides TaxID=1746091 RepID=A0AAV7ZGQ3_9EUKA|nr:malate dehydrogenase [Anaeramoeba flamelloides]KAJ6235635.1 malate dehydrogenase [Anaeramoeba flamelloides]
MTQKEPITVAITGAAGNIAYSLIFRICSGELFGNDQPFNLHLIDIEPALPVLEGLVMELQDSNFHLINKTICTTDPFEGFRDADYAILLGSYPRNKNQTRKDLLGKNVSIFKIQGKALSFVAKKTVKVVVVGNPVNTNALVTAKYAENIPKENIVALTRLDMNRSISQLSKKLNKNTSNIKNVFTWGNHSASQFVDLSNGYLLEGSKKTPLTELVEKEWIYGEFQTTNQTRGKAVILKRGKSSAGSAANAVMDCLKSWIYGTETYVSMGVISDNNPYNVPENLIFSFPCTCKNGSWKIAKDLKPNEFCKKMIKKNVDELVSERNIAFGLLQD